MYIAAMVPFHVNVLRASKGPTDISHEYGSGSRPEGVGRGGQLCVTSYNWNMCVSLDAITWTITGVCDEGMFWTTAHHLLHCLSAYVVGIPAALLDLHNFHRQVPMFTCHSNNTLSTQPEHGQNNVTTR